MDDEENRKHQAIRTKLIEELVDYFDDKSMDEITAAVDCEMKLKSNKSAELSLLRKKVLKRIRTVESTEEKQDQIHIDMRKEILGE